MQPQINPVTGDYTGERISNLSNAVWLRIRTPRGSWWADKALGSRLHLLTREKDVARVEALAKSYALEALQPLLDDKRASAITADTARKDGRLLLIVRTVDATGQAATHEFEGVI